MAGFTALTEKIDPEVVTDVMNEVFAALGAEVEAVGGHVDKVVGDELMGLFGAPVAHEGDAPPRLPPPPPPLPRPRGGGRSGGGPRGQGRGRRTDGPLRRARGS